MQIPPPDSDAQPISSSRKSSWKWALRLALGILIVMALLRGNPAASVGPVLSRVSPLILIAAVALYEVGQLLSALRWRSVFNVLGADEAKRQALSMSDAARIYFAGMFWNLWMPTGIGGDAFRAYAASQRLRPGQGNLVAGASSVLLDRVVGLAALVTVCAVGLALDARGGASGASKVLWATVGALMLVVGLALVARGTLRRLAANRKAQYLESRWSQIERLFEQFKTPPQRKVLWSALALSFGIQGLQIAINFGLARAVGLDVPPATFVWLGPALALSSLLPLGIGGLGVREAAAVALLQNSGAPVGTIIAWSLMWQATLWLSSLPGGLWAFNARFVQAKS